MATTITTRRDSLMASISVALQYHANKHDGKLPQDIDTIFEGVSRAQLEYELKGPISSKVFYFPEGLPTPNGEALIAVIAFPIQEDRRIGLGRQIVFRKNDGKIHSRWESEDFIQACATSAGVVLPKLAVFQEEPLLVLDPRYTEWLVVEAKKRNVPTNEAIAIIDAHIAKVRRHDAKMATSWAELVPAATPKGTVLTAPTPIPSPSPSPLKTSPTSFDDGDRRPLIWPWVGGATLLVAIIALGLNRRASTREGG